MKCPLIKIVQQVASATLEVAPADCLKEKCAWWDEVEEGRCAILSLVGTLDLIAVRLMHIDAHR